MTTISIQTRVDFLTTWQRMTESDGESKGRKIEAISKAQDIFTACGGTPEAYALCKQLCNDAESLPYLSEVSPEIRRTRKQSLARLLARGIKATFAVTVTVSNDGTVKEVQDSKVSPLERLVSNCLKVYPAIEESHFQKFFLVCATEQNKTRKALRKDADKVREQAEKLATGEMERRLASYPIDKKNLIVESWKIQGLISDFQANLLIPINS